ncbi:MAG: hypothetical protein AAGC43_17435 [Bacteroidota bacterium]
MNTFAFIITMMVTFFSYSENDEALSTTRVLCSPQVFTCPADQCAARVVICNDKFIRSIIINKAFNAIQTRPNFDSIYEQNTGQWTIIRDGGNTYSVHVPFANGQGV